MSGSVFAAQASTTCLSPLVARSPVGVAGGVVSGGAAVVLVIVAAALMLPAVSLVNTAYEYVVEAANPVSVTDVAVGVPSGTPVPSVAWAGAVVPLARRTMIWARSGSAGLVQDSSMLVWVAVPVARLVTGAGGVTSGGGAVLTVIVARVETLPAASLAKTA